MHFQVSDFLPYCLNQVRRRSPKKEGNNKNKPEFTTLHVTGKFFLELFLCPLQTNKINKLVNPFFLILKMSCTSLEGRRQDFDMFHRVSHVASTSMPDKLSRRVKAAVANTGDPHFTCQVPV